MLGAAVESVLGLPTVARFKTLGHLPDIDALIARAGTPAANRKLARLLEKQAFPRYGIGPAGTGAIVAHAKGSRRRSGKANAGATAS